MAAEELSADSIKGDFHIASTQATPHSPQGSNSPRALASAYQAGMSHCPPDPASMTTTTTPHQPFHPPPSRVGFGSKATAPHRSPSQLWAHRHRLWFLTHCPLADMSSSSQHQKPQSSPVLLLAHRFARRRPALCPAKTTSSPPHPRPHRPGPTLTSPALDPITRAYRRHHVRLDAHRPSFVPVPTDQAQ